MFQEVRGFCISDNNRTLKVWAALAGIPIEVLAAALGADQRLGSIELPELPEPRLLLNTLTTQWLNSEQEHCRRFVFLSASGGGFFKSGVYGALVDQINAKERIPSLGRRVSDMEFLAACVCRWHASRDPLITTIPRVNWIFHQPIDTGIPSFARYVRTIEQSLCNDDFVAQPRGLRVYALKHFFDSCVYGCDALEDVQHNTSGNLFTALFLNIGRTQQ
jgi:hypothetical protein